MSTTSHTTGTPRDRHDAHGAAGAHDGRAVRRTDPGRGAHVHGPAGHEVPVTHGPTATAAPLETLTTTALPASGAGARWLAVTRIVLALVFLWAFADKTFGLGWATPHDRAWVRGGSPTRGFLASVDVGPFTDTFHAMAGNAVVDWLFMLGLLGIGLALLAGVAMVVTAWATSMMMVMMWAAEWPPARFTTAGDPSGSVNPLVDYHLIYAVTAIALAATFAGHSWGLGRRWQNTRLVRRLPWLR